MDEPFYFALSGPVYLAIPSFGGMSIALLTVLVVPVLYCWRKVAKLTK